MPVFNAHIAKGQLSKDQKQALADAFVLAIHDALNAPMDDQFVIINEHSDDNLFIHPTFPNMNRTDKRMIVTVDVSTTRTLDEKRKLTDLVTKYAVEKAGIGQDDIALLIYALPLENMSFGGGKLMPDDMEAMAKRTR
ncbi:tautomerase family protein [Moraxella caviae]|uniref:4-oxalocrotonate tautomerase n=1 Tax=Moraxella caviae TaxID=34060 RepID=A0A1T0ABS8_9GAMM|nr:tautomerase family protein [Moraxella caviae]OOR93185.1 tautomerase family protein [Moraxella caviae]STZ10456.1 4-oxalocrotonate tautomerase [Moraxella caviae]VEW10688.1 4-oxalocrotonate tautomerase [Moraxella caviae]